MPTFNDGESGSSVRAKINETITVVDGLDTGDDLLMDAAERTKLAGIENGATADQTGAEIKALYEGEADTNAFTDAEKVIVSRSLLEALAQTPSDGDLAVYNVNGDIVPQPASSVSLSGTTLPVTLATVDSGGVVLGSIMVGGANGNITSESVASLNFALTTGNTCTGTWDFTGATVNGLPGGGTVTSVAVSGSDGIEVDSGSPITGAGTIALGVNAATMRTTLNVENGATADQTGAEIKALYEGEADTNAFTDANVTKLGNAVESDPAGVTGADSVPNMMSLTTAEYGAITPVADTLYLITDAT